MSFSPSHFKGKDALSHVTEAQVQGIIARAEIHGAEIPGSLFSAADASRDTVIILSIVGLSLNLTEFNFSSLLLLALFGFGLLLWKMGRSGWLGWARLERLHRILTQEKWEIEHNREQEREELTALYAAKGLNGKLLEDVIDVLMADENRLLEVMVREELGLSLEHLEHPLKQSLSAGLGVFLTTLIVLFFFWMWPVFGLYFATLLVLIGTGALVAHFNGNKLIPAIVWSVGIGVLALGSTSFLLDYLHQIGMI